MDNAWLHRTGQRDCLLFFSGWGMDPEPFRAMPAEGLDLCMLFDYRTLGPISLESFAGYERLHLLAWSMGVWVAGHLLARQAEVFATSTALAGTLAPVDEKRGIPPASYQALVDAFDQQTLDGFYRSMFDDEAQHDRFLALRPKRSIPELDQELRAFRQAFDQHGPGEDIFHRAIVTGRDRIYSGRNQLRAWGKERSIVTNWSHFPFFACSGWRALLSSGDEAPPPSG